MVFVKKPFLYISFFFGVLFLLAVNALIIRWLHSGYSTLLKTLRGGSILKNSPYTSNEIETVVLDPKGVYYLPPSTYDKPLKIILLVHLYRAAYSAFVLRTWAKRRVLRLVYSLADNEAAGYVLLQPLTFDASPELGEFREELPQANHLSLPVNFTATMRIEALLPRAFLQYPDAQWAFKADDDTFLHPERLVVALLEKNSSVPMLVGHMSSPVWGHFLFLSGGAGYAISRAALELLVKKIPHCTSEEYGFRNIGEDVMIAKCAKEFLGEGVLVDHSGLNWGSPEEMLSAGLYFEPHSRVPPITHHHISSSRGEALVNPTYPRRLSQVWPYDSPPSQFAQLQDSSESYLFGLLFGPSQEKFTYPCGAPTEKDFLSIKSCRELAGAAGFEYKLVPSARHLFPLLLPAAIEQVTLWEALYLNGGLVVPLSTTCSELGSPEELMLLAEAEGKRLQDSSDSSYTRWFLGSPHQSLVSVLSPGHNSPPKAWAASEFNHGVFRVMATQTMNLSARLVEDGSLHGNCSDNHAYATRIDHSERILKGDLTSFRLVEQLHVAMAWSSTRGEGKSDVSLGSCPPLPIVSGLRIGAYFFCSYPQDWFCLSGLGKQLAKRLSTQEFPFVYHPACFNLDIHPRMFFCGSQGACGGNDGGAHLLYNSSDVRIVVNGEADVIRPVISAYGEYDLGISGIKSLPFEGLYALGSSAPAQVYMPYVTFAVLQNEDFSETDLLKAPNLSNLPKTRLFAAYATRHCEVPARNQFYALLDKYRPIHALNKNCHGGLDPPDGILTDRANEQTWLKTVVQRYTKYKFIVAFENQIVDGYVTEKIANVKKAGAIPIYYGSASVTDLFNPASFIDCTPKGNENLTTALNRCVEQVSILDLDDKAWLDMAQQPFLKNNAPFDYKPLGAVIRGIHECKRRGAGGCNGEQGPLCGHLIGSSIVEKAFFVPPQWGGCTSAVKKPLVF